MRIAMKGLPTPAATEPEKTASYFQGIQDICCKLREYRSKARYTDNTIALKNRIALKQVKLNICDNRGEMRDQFYMPEHCSFNVDNYGTDSGRLRLYVKRKRSGARFDISASWKFVPWARENGKAAGLVLGGEEIHSDMYGKVYLVQYASPADLSLRTGYMAWAASDQLGTKVTSLKAGRAYNQAAYTAEFLARATA